MSEFVTPIHLRVIGHAQRRPDRIAVRHDGSGYPYGGLALRSRCAASALAERGVRAGDRVAADCPDGPRFLEILLACGILGAVFVPMNQRWDHATAAAVLADSGATLVIRPDAADGIPTGAGAMAAVDFDRGIIASGPHPVPGVLPADRLALLAYTSGTTSAPKGVMLTHGNLVVNAEHVVAATGLSARDVALPAAPLARIGALGMIVLPALFAGARLVLPTSTEPADLVTLAGAEAVTVMFAGPEGYTRLRHHQGFDAASLPNLRVALCGGSPLPSSVAGRLAERGVPVRLGYGMTEAAPLVTISRQGHRDGMVGTAVPGVEVRVIGASGRSAPPGEPGEIQVRGGNVTPGYWRRPTDSALDPSGWLHTGDAGRLAVDGELEVLGRIRDAVTVRGRTLYPDRVEAELRGLAGVLDAAVTTDTDGTVVLLVAPFDIPAPDGVADCCRAEGWPAPSRIARVRAIPRNANGKIIRDRLLGAAHDATVRSRAATGVAP